MQNPEDARLTPYGDADEMCEYVVAGLWIYPGDITPDEVTRMLCVEPTGVRVRGTEVPSARTKTRRIRVNAWYQSSEGMVDSLDIRLHLDWVLDRVWPARDEILALQRRDGVKMYMLCSWWARYTCGGFALWPAQMARMAELGLEWSVQVSFYGEDEE